MASPLQRLREYLYTPDAGSPASDGGGGAVHTSVQCFGWGANGQLGVGDRETRIAPAAVKSLRVANVVAVVCGSRFTVSETLL